MEKLVVDIENCYGIHSLNHEFEFTENNRTCAIYAPNGIMKTSFSKVFDDISKNKDSFDLIYTEKVSKRNIYDESSSEINSESIFVIKPFDKNYKSEKMSTLLVNEELRTKYEELHKEILELKNTYFSLVRDKFTLKKTANIELEILKIFNNNDNFFETISNNIDDIKKASGINSNVNYGILFDDKNLNFINNPDVKNNILDYITKYNELLEKSTYLKSGFNHYNAESIHKSLNDHGYFSADHSIILNKNTDKTEINNSTELLKLINDEKENILKDDDIKNKFSVIDKKISNAQLRSLRDYLFKNQDILTLLLDMEKLRKDTIYSYLNSEISSLESMVNKYKEVSKNIEDIIKLAKEQTTEWENVIEIFHRRFFVPFKLVIDNKEDSVIKNNAPTLSYNFEDRPNIETNTLFDVLSQGEQRAFYLLNIIFEIESRKKSDVTSLLIIDDIADSFDYKNKYAIIEYLKDISNEECFKSILLTHNYDFFRTVQEKVGMNKYLNSFIASRNENEVKLDKLQYKYISNPFKFWKSKMNDNSVLISSIPFIRNLAEYTGDTASFNTLTSLLHVKSDTYDLSISDIFELFEKVVIDIPETVIDNPESNYYSTMIDIADNTLNHDSNTNGFNLENKILLSIAIRLVAEEFMIKKINDDEFVSEISSYQTAKLLKKYKTLNEDEVDILQVLDRVSLMTTENIHLNSFMFEPIIDMSDDHLKSLYKDVCKLGT